MQRFQNILLVCEQSHLNDPAVVRAIELARLNKAKLRVVDVVPLQSLGIGLKSVSEKLEEFYGEMIAQRRNELSELFKEYSGELDISVAVLTGKTFVELIHYVQKKKCDLLVKSVSSEKNISAMLFGSTDLRLLRKCPCPVWLVKRDDKDKTEKILAAVDLEALHDGETLDPLTNQIVEIATSMAERRGCELNFVNSWIVFDGGRLASKLSKQYKDDVALWQEEQRKNIESAQEKFVKLFQDLTEKKKMKNVVCNFHFLEGQAEDVIVDLTEREKMDLVIMGTVARTDLAGFLVGNTSEAVLNRIDCSVLAIKPPGFKSPLVQEESE